MVHTAACGCLDSGCCCCLLWLLLWLLLGRHLLPAVLATVAAAVAAACCVAAAGGVFNRSSTTAALQPLGQNVDEGEDQADSNHSRQHQRVLQCQTHPHKHMQGQVGISYELYLQDNEGNQ
jgi:hypothetical protein